MSENFSASTDHRNLEDPINMQQQSSPSWQPPSPYRAEHQIMNKEEFMQQIEQQNNAMNFQIFLMKSIPLCFKKCIAKPGASLDNYEHTCVNRCAELYAETYRFVGQSFHQRMQTMINDKIN